MDPDTLADEKNILPENTVKRKRRWMIPVGMLIICIIVIAITVPLVLVRKNSKDSNISISNKNSASNSNNAALDNMNNKQITETILITANEQQSLHPPVYAHAVSPYANLTRIKILYPVSRRIFVMGDVHGCLNEMNALLSKVSFDPKQDILILTGDMVFRGPDSIGVIRRARELGAFCVRGNHEDKLIRLKGFEYQHGIQAMSPPEQVMPEGNVGDPLLFGNSHVELSRKLNVEDYEYLAGCPLILDIPDLNARVVHGGLDPFINLVDNDPWSVMNMRDMDSNNQPSKLKLTKEEGVVQAEHWTAVYQNYKDATASIFYGHDASRGVVMTDKTIGLDSGCVYGRKLSIIEIKTRQLTQIDCIGGIQEVIMEE